MNRAEAYVHYFKTFYQLADQRCRDYWGGDKPNGQAAGLESLIHFAGMLIAPRARPVKRGHLMVFDPDPDNVCVVDAGAGASSAILRTYFKNVISCDPDGDYLMQVKRACEAMGLGHGQWVPGIPTGAWDACFYDYGTHERIPSFPTFLARTRQLIWIDDAHDDGLVQACRDRSAPRWVAFMYGSVDEYGRYGAVVRKT